MSNSILVHMFWPPLLLDLLLLLLLLLCRYSPLRAFQKTQTRNSLMSRVVLRDASRVVKQQQHSSSTAAAAGAAVAAAR